MRKLLTRNRIWNCAIWNSTTQHFLAIKLKNCKDCIASSTPAPSRKVSVATLNRNLELLKLNEVAAVDHVYLDDIKLIHFIDTVTRLSACIPCSSLSKSISEENFAFKTVLLNQFRSPQHIHGDQAFLIEEFQKFLKLNDIEFCHVPRCRHSNNLLEPKHGVIKRTSIRLKSA